MGNNITLTITSDELKLILIALLSSYSKLEPPKDKPYDELLEKLTRYNFETE